VELVPTLEIAGRRDDDASAREAHKTRTAYLWTFLGRAADDKEIITYEFSPS
jgi:hypothetical protein